MQGRGCFRQTHITEENSELSLILLYTSIYFDLELYLKFNLQVAAVTHVQS